MYEKFNLLFLSIVFWRWESITKKRLHLNKSFGYFLKQLQLYFMGHSLVALGYITISYSLLVHVIKHNCMPIGKID